MTIKLHCGTPLFSVDFLHANFHFVGNDKDNYRRRESTMIDIDIEVEEYLKAHNCDSYYTFKPIFLSVLGTFRF